MAEKKNEVMENAEVLHDTEAPKETGIVFDSFDPFAREREREENGYEREGSIAVFDVGIILHRKFSKPDKDGKVWSNFRIAFTQTVGGKVLPHTINVVPGARSEEIYLVVNAIFGEEDKKTIQITKTTTVDYNNNNAKRINYGLQITGKDDSGVIITMPMRPQDTQDRYCFNNLVEILKHRGAIT